MHSTLLITAVPISMDLAYCILNILMLLHRYMFHSTKPVSLRWMMYLNLLENLPSLNGIDLMIPSIMTIHSNLYLLSMYLILNPYLIQIGCTLQWKFVELMFLGSHLLRLFLNLFGILYLRCLNMLEMLGYIMILAGNNLN